MNKIVSSTITAFIVVLVVSVICLQSSFVSADQGITDQQALAADIKLEVEPSISYERAAHAANGVALRERVGGTIHLRGVPEGAFILNAYLYFSYLDTMEIGNNWAGVIFNGNLINAQKVADSEAPCWSPMVGIHTYRARVTKFVPKGLANQDYQVTLPTRKVDTDGENPWYTDTADQLLEGATLVVVYRTPETVSNIYIYDAFNNSMFSSSGTFMLYHAYHTGGAYFTMTGADGQKNIPNETTTFNGVQIAGPGGYLSASDWDGSAGWPLPQLWDVNTHKVDLNDAFSMVVYNAFGDCLVPVAMVIEAY